VHRAALLLAAVLALAACAGGVGGGPDVTGEWELADGTADGVPLPQPPGSRATLQLGGGEVGGISFCNHYFSSYRLTGSSFTVDGLGGTEMGCEPEVMAAETAYLAALAAVDTAAADGDGLVLTGDGVELRFTPVAPVPDSPVEGTRWVLESVIDGESASSTVGAPAVLLLDPDRTAEASTGCRSLTGTWLVEDGALVIDDLLAADAECPADVERQDAHVTAVLGGGPTLAVEGSRLTLTGDDGRGLDYRAEAVAEELLGSWALAESSEGEDPLPIPAAARATLTFSAGSRAGGSSFCNGYGGTYVLDGDRLRLEDVAVSLVACEGPVGAAEGAYLDLLLDRSHRVVLTGDRLLLESEAGRLAFDRLPPVPVEELTDRRWALEAVVHGNGTVPASGPATLELRSDGTATVATGCRDFEASWHAAGDAVQLSGWEYELVDCPAEVAGQDEALVQVLGGSFRPQLDGDVLTVGAVDTRGAETPALLYRAS
jgi:heat shock protein HslJ